MKGEALITIKDKDGKIKQQVKEKNTVFDIPKEILKGIVASSDVGTSVPFSESPSYYMNSGYNNIFNVLSFYLWFMSISVNDELCSELTYKDYKVPVLYGGEYSKQNTSNNRYAYIDTANSSINENVMKKVYTWNNCPAFTIKSINLKHAYNACNTYAMHWGDFPVKAYGKFHWFTAGYSSSNYQANGLQPGVLAEKDKFAWNKTFSGRTFKTLKNTSFSTGGSGYYFPSIFACKDREIIILRKSNDLTTDDSQFSGQSDKPSRYLFVIDADTGNIKRNFDLANFSGIEVYQSYPYYYPNISYLRIIATEYGNFLLATKKEPSMYSSQRMMCLWRIPDQSEMANYSNNETVPIWLEDLNSSLPSNWNYFTTIVDNCIIYVGSSNRNVVKINSATPGDVTLYNYVPFNLPSGLSQPNNWVPYIYSRYADYIYNPRTSGIEIWYNTTVLNLSKGVEVAEGDTVTIEYTITAN